MKILWLFLSLIHGSLALLSLNKSLPPLPLPHNTSHCTITPSRSPFPMFIAMDAWNCTSLQHYLLQIHHGSPLSYKQKKELHLVPFSGMTCGLQEQVWLGAMIQNNMFSLVRDYIEFLGHKTWNGKLKCSEQSLYMMKADHVMMQSVLEFGNAAMIEWLVHFIEQECRGHKKIIKQVGQLLLEAALKQPFPNHIHHLVLHTLVKASVSLSYYKATPSSRELYLLQHSDLTDSSVLPHVLSLVSLDRDRSAFRLMNAVKSQRQDWITSYFYDHVRNRHTLDMRVVDLFSLCSACSLDSPMGHYALNCTNRMRYFLMHSTAMHGNRALLSRLLLNYRIPSIPHSVFQLAVFSDDIKLVWYIQRYQSFMGREPFVFRLDDFIRYQLEPIHTPTLARQKRWEMKVLTWAILNRHLLFEHPDHLNIVLNAYVQYGCGQVDHFRAIKRILDMGGTLNETHIDVLLLNALDVYKCPCNASVDMLLEFIIKLGARPSSLSPYLALATGRLDLVRLVIKTMGHTLYPIFPHNKDGYSRFPHNKETRVFLQLNPFTLIQALFDGPSFLNQITPLLPSCPLIQKECEWYARYPEIMHHSPPCLAVDKVAYHVMWYFDSFRRASHSRLSMQEEGLVEYVFAHVHSLMDYYDKPGLVQAQGAWNHLKKNFTKQVKEAGLDCFQAQKQGILKHISHIQARIHVKLKLIDGLFNK